MKKTKEEIEFAKLYRKCMAESIASIKTCYHPKCNENSINSHILQKNGILSSIDSGDRHLWELAIDQFKTPPFQFKKTGINEIYSFNCFCNKHDTDLFKKIESEEIDFSDYTSCLLFTLITIYNEIFRKQVNLKTYSCYIKNEPEKFDNPKFKNVIKQEELGVQDLQLSKNDIWSDLENGTESFVFEHRELDKIELCVSSFYNYDTTEEMSNFRRKFGKDMERVAEVFMNFFPYKDKSILLMGYNKKDEQRLKGYFYSFFKENSKKVCRKITNLVIFQCETSLFSDKFYLENIKGIEEYYADAVNFSCHNPNERKTFDLNFTTDNFRIKFKQWKTKNVG